MGIDNTTTINVNPTKPVTASVAAQLASALNLPTLDSSCSEYVQFREDDDYYYVDIGRSETITALWQESYDRMKALDEKFNRTMLAILHELQAEELETSKAGSAAQPAVALNAVTPSKSNRQQAASKRPAPGSSSVNKVILHRAKRSTGEHNQAAGSATSASGTLSRGRKQLFESTGKANADIQGDRNAAKKSQATGSKTAKPFIAVEQSIEGPGGNGGNIVDASVASANTSLVPRTRAQARLLASGGTACIKPIMNSASKVAGSTSKTTRSRKATAAAVVEDLRPSTTSGFSTPSRSGRGGTSRAQAKGNFISKEDSTASKRNATPQRAGRNVIDLSSVSVTIETGGRKVMAAGGKALTTNYYNTTPNKHGASSSSASASMASSCCSAGAPGTPSSIRRAELERTRQEKLLLSEDKRKKADEKKKDMLELRAQRLKEERDARMEKIRENKLALERQNEAKAKEVLSSASKPSFVKPANPAPGTRVNARRRAALESATTSAVAAPSLIDLSESKPKTRAARNAAANSRAAAAAAQKADSVVGKKATAASATKTSTAKNTRGKKAAAAVANGSKGGKSATSASSSSATTSGGKRKLFFADDDEVDTGNRKMPPPPPPLPASKPVATLSPIAKVAGAGGQPEGINTRLNETFTTEAVLRATIEHKVTKEGTASGAATTSTSTSTSATAATKAPEVITSKDHHQQKQPDHPPPPASSVQHDHQTGWVFVDQSTGKVHSPALGTPAHSTFVADVTAAIKAAGDHITFAIPAIPAECFRNPTTRTPNSQADRGLIMPASPRQQVAGPSSEVAGSNISPFNMAKKLLTPKNGGGGGSGGRKSAGSGKKKGRMSVTQYEMTPPPAPEPADNYDISRYIDSDDEEEQQRHEKTAPGKRIPAWALGKAFLSALHKQFRQKPEALADQTASLFVAPLLPVPLDEMGLPVRNRYAVRSSSVNWKTAEAISKGSK